MDVSVYGLKIYNLTLIISQTLVEIENLNAYFNQKI